MNVIHRSLSFSHPKADEILEIASNEDLRGCLIGCSSGGMVFIFIPPMGTDEMKLKKAYKKAKFKCVSNVLGAPGVSVDVLEERARSKSIS
jgi:hypothetical protein